MTGMTVQAVRVRLATAMIESSSSSLDTSPSNLSFSAYSRIMLRLNILWYSLNVCQEHCLRKGMITHLHRLEPLSDLRGLLEAGVLHREGGGSLRGQRSHAAPGAREAHFTGSGLKLESCDI